MSSRSSRRVPVLLAGVGLTSAAFLVAPTSMPAAFAAPPTDCTSTGGTVGGYTVNGVQYITNTFNTVGVNVGTFTPAQTLTNNVEWLVVGGGGAGGGAPGASGGGGGGSGAVVSLTGQSISAAQSITVGAGGTAVNNAAGGNGSVSSIGSLASAPGGGGGGLGTTGTAAVVTNDGLAGTGSGASGGGGGGSNATTTSGGASGGGSGFIGGAGFAGNSAAKRAGGGGGGTAAGGAASNGNGGIGAAGTGNTIVDGSTSVRYGGGGGGGAATPGTVTNSAGGAGGSAGVGTAATANRGGGGGGGRDATVSTAGGGGGSGFVVIKYPKYCLNPSQPSAGAVPGLAGSSPNQVLSWTAPTYIPSGATPVTYTVVFRLTSGGTDWRIYARGGTAVSVNISNKTTGPCQTANSGYTCPITNAVVANNGTMAAGTYDYRVFAKASTGTFGWMSATRTSVVIP